MKNIIHDWNDDDARRILLNCRRAVPDDGALLLVVRVGEANAPSLGKMVDIVMLTVTGGKERTVDQHRGTPCERRFSTEPHDSRSLNHQMVILEALR